MSLLQQAQLNRTASITSSSAASSNFCTAYSSSGTQEIDIGAARFILIRSRVLTTTEMDALKYHGQVVEYNTQFFQGVATLDSVKFTYLIFDINEVLPESGFRTIFLLLLTML